MSKKTKEVNEESVDVKKYQWVKGDKYGTVEEYKSTEDGWVYFSSGNRINESLLNEYLLEVGEEELDFDPPNKNLQQAATEFKQEVQKKPK